MSIAYLQPLTTQPWWLLDVPLSLILKKKPISGSSDAKKKLQQSHSVVDYQTEFTFGEMFQELFDLASKT